MCIIAVCKRPLSLEEFKNCWENNDDGFGMAWIEEDGELFVHNIDKGHMTFKSAVSAHNENMPKIKRLPYVCHFRQISVGRRLPGLTHPFVIASDAAVDEDGFDETQFQTYSPVLFHNGHFSEWESTLVSVSMNHGYPPGLISDTKVLCTALGIATEKYGWSACSQLLSTISGKFVSINGGEVTTFGAFCDSDDRQVLFSNLTFKNRKRQINSYEGGAWL